MTERFTVLVMAAGRGTRMRSSMPKVLHPICGKPMVQWVIDAARAAGAAEVVCVTRRGDGVAAGLPEGVTVAEQREGEGTGAAVLAARDAGGTTGAVVVLSGDHPLISAELIAELIATHHHHGAAATILTTDELDPAGYGRIVRGADGAVDRIVETKYTEGLSQDELAIREVNLGTYVFEAGDLWEALDAVAEERGERYLTGVFPLLRGSGKPVITHLTRDVSSAVGVNDRVGLMEAERLAQRRLLEHHARAGVSFLAPESIRVEADVQIGQDTTVGPGVTLRGATRVGEGCTLGPATTITDSTLGDHVTATHSFLVQAAVEDRVSLGPFAYLRPGAHIGEAAKIGTFVEVKNSEIGAGAKVPHLSYLGDTDVGEGANVAAGNITANYDGFAKHRTVIGKGAKTGVNASYVAPVSVGEGAYIAAGAVITDDVPDGALGISRPEQKNVEGYAERVEKERG
ncbi:MAG TPA: bifunctional UDP-N-acetylglucosamine diphosphorylase/glucosamine-1-phosphate N-acetyltransferase GlmU [Thermoleophilaceae bacterium]|nr:bifunctional UDP-N-acetylglucosamine diphosphorylase/glucosamine-1-phosphate N-acetyltransferase GlmU [Thermoleophilaceae bacterium]